MKISHNTITKGSVITLFSVLIGTVLTVACGGGGSGDGPLGSTISGVAATGAAFEDATITIYGSNSDKGYTCPVTTTSVGFYECTVPATLKAPYVVKAEKSGVSASDGTTTTERQFSVIAEVTNNAATANITPLTTLVVAMLSSTGDPINFASEMNTDITKANALALKSQVDILQTNLQSLIDITIGNGEKINPISGPLTAGSGKGMDKLLDSISVTTTPTNGGTAGHIDIALSYDPATALSIVKGQESTPTNGIASANLTNKLAKLSLFTGTYNMQAFTSDNETTIGTLDVSSTGVISNCKVGYIVHCNGQLNLIQNGTAANFKISGGGDKKDDSGNVIGHVSAKFTGKVDSSFNVTGNINAYVTPDNVALTGTLGGAKKQ
jgi:hypothetical protein